MKRILCAALTLLCVLALCGFAGCSAGDFPTAQDVSSYLTRTRYLQNDISEMTRELSLKWQSSELALTDVTVVDKRADGENAAQLDCRVTAENEILRLVRYLRFSCENGLTGWSVKSHETIRGDEWEAALSIPEIVTKLDSEAFKGQTELTSVTMTDSVVDLGPSVFEDCSNLRTVKMSAGVSYLPPAVFKNCSRLESVDISDETDAFLKEAFRGCTSLKLEKLPDFVTFIGTDAFAECPDLTAALKIPQYLQAIQDGAFRGCTALKKVEIGKSLDTLGATAFEGCANLTSVTVADDNPYMVMNGKTLVYAADQTPILQLP